MTPFGEKYLSIQIHYFSIKCTRCSAEIVFRTDPKNNDYAMVKGAQRNIEPWHNRAAAEETDEQRLQRLEREEAEAEAEEDGKNGIGRDVMADLEAQDQHARREMAVADALDQRRQRNARIERADKDGVSFVDTIVRAADVERDQAERDLEEQARREFAAKRGQLDLSMSTIEEEEDAVGPVPQLAGKPMADTEPDVPAASAMPALPKPAVNSFAKKPKAKKNYAALAGLKKA